MENIIIREARPGDARQMLDYLRQIGGESDNLTFGAEGLPFTEAAVAAYLQGVLEDPRTLALVALRDDQIVGDISLTPLPRRMSHRAEVGLSVVKAEWNKGVGSALLRRAIAHAKAAGIELLNLEVRSDNAPAIHLYEKFGFRKIGTSPAFFKVNGAYVDFELMYLDLR